jgi:hypothetical protein
MAHSARTTAALAPMLAIARKRLIEAGARDDANCFIPSEAGDFQHTATSSTGDALLQSLLHVEAHVVKQAV